MFEKPATIGMNEDLLKRLVKFLMEYFVGNNRIMVVSIYVPPSMDSIHQIF
jgi:hypothetical protein